MRCYVCNRKMVDKPTDSSQCKEHGEHVIHNGIRGKLISRAILCKECGEAHSKDDVNFCKIFAPYVVALSDRMIPADRGKTDGNMLKGSLFKTPDVKESEEGIEITAKNGEVISIDDKGKASIDYDRAKRTPFIPTALFDILYEVHR